MSQPKNVVYPRVRHMTASIALLAGFAMPAQAQVVFSPPKNISNSLGIAQDQRIAVGANGNIYVIWLDNSVGPFAVFFSHSGDGGITFSSPLNISNHAGSHAFTDQIAVSATGNIYVIWSDDSLGYSSEFLARSIDGGSTFAPPQQISNAGASGGGGQVAVDARGNVNVVWSDNSPGFSAVFFSRSSDGGASFSSPVKVSSNPLGAFNPNISLDPAGDVFVAWAATVNFFCCGLRTMDVFFSGSTAGGTNFSSPTQVSNNNQNQPNASIGTPQVAASSVSNINVLWDMTGFQPPTFSYRRSSNGGATFGPTFTQGGCEFPPSARLALDSLGAANLLWQVSCGNGFSNVNYARTTDGSSFASNFIWSGPFNTPFPQLTVDGSNTVDVVLSSGLPGILFTRSSDEGATFSAAQNVSFSDSGFLPKLTADRGGNVYVVWQAGVNTENIFFSRSVALSSLDLQPASVRGAATSTGTVVLNGPAPIGGAVVSLSSSNPSVADLPASVTIPEGGTSATFAVTTNAVATSTSVSISASFNGVTQTHPLKVRP